MNSAFASFAAFYRSSIGKKLVVALTGVAMIGFLFGHLAGNLKIYAGAEKLNSYGAWLHSMPVVLWGARLGLITCFVAHIVTTILLVRQNRAARDTQYAYKATVQATSASRTMMVSGLIVLSFVIYHLLHYTVHVGNEYGGASYFDSEGRHDVYKMVVDGFSWAPASMFYVFAMALLCWHLSHGFASVFQTLGLRTERSWPAIKAAGYAVATILFVGNVSIPVAVLFGWVNY